MNNNKNIFFDISEFLPDIDKEGIEAFNKIYNILTKRQCLNQIQSEEQLFEYITKIASINYNYSKELDLKLSSKEEIDLIQYSKIYYNSYIEYLSELMVKPFWKAEYIKRGYFINKTKKKTIVSTLKEFKIIKKWQKYLTDQLTYNNCNLKYCFYRNENITSKALLKAPFFYNYECNPCKQAGKIPGTVYAYIINDCLFKSELTTTLISYFNSKIASDNNKIRDLRLLVYGMSENYFDTYCKKDLQELDILTRISYAFGLSVLDLFSLTSPWKLLNDCVKNNTKIGHEIIKFKFPDFFLHKNSVKLKETEEIIEKFNDPTNMAVIRRNPNIKSLDPSLIENKLKNFEFVIGIDSDILSSDFCLKQELDKIKNALLDFKPNNNFILDPNKHQYQYIIFAFNPSAPSFINESGVSKKIVDDIELVINSYRTYYIPLIDQIEKYQKEKTKIYNRIERVKNYQEKDVQRAIGLYIWDEVNFYNKTVSNAIHSFIESELWQKIDKLTPKQINERKIENENKYKYSIGTQDDYNKIKGYFEVACECIKQRSILTGSMVEQIKYKGMKKIRRNQLKKQKK